MVIPEPLRVSHRDPVATANSIKQTVSKSLATLAKKSITALLDDRYARIRKLGSWEE